MKSLLALILSLALVAFTADAFAEEWDKYRHYVAKDTEEIYATWVNLEVKSNNPQKLIYRPNGIVEYFYSANPEAGRYLILNKWSDSEGNIWYKKHSVNWYHEYYSLIKISNSGNTLEVVRDRNDYPTKIDPKHDFYNKCSRE